MPDGGARSIAAADGPGCARDARPHHDGRRRHAVALLPQIGTLRSIGGAAAPPLRIADDGKERNPQMRLTALLFACGAMALAQESKLPIKVTRSDAPEKALQFEVVVPAKPEVVWTAF